MKHKIKYNRYYVSRLFELGYFGEGEFVDSRNADLVEIS